MGPPSRHVLGTRCGAVTVLQRFGGALNLNVHFHSLVPDGVFVRDGELGRVRFVRVPAPTTEDVERLVEKVAARVTRWLARRGFADEEPAVEDDPDDAGVLLQAASAAGRAALGKRAGRRAERIRTVAGRVVQLPPRCAALDGYNLHAGVVVGGHDVEAVERLCRYICRPALAKSRIEPAPGGGVVLRFKRPWSDGTTGLRLTELELVQRLAALVPPPRANMLLYHGVFAPCAAWRDQVVALPPEPQPSRGRLKKRSGHGEPRRGRRWPCCSTAGGSVVARLRGRRLPMSAMWRPDGGAGGGHAPTGDPQGAARPGAGGSAGASCQWRPGSLSAPSTSDGPLPEGGGRGCARRMTKSRSGPRTTGQGRTWTCFPRCPGPGGAALSSLAPRLKFR